MLIAQEPNSMRTPETQPRDFLQYFSLAPILAIVSVSVAISTWIIINYFLADILFHPVPW
jgi:photosystem I subunit 9